MRKRAYLGVILIMVWIFVPFEVLGGETNGSTKKMKTRHLTMVNPMAIVIILYWVISLEMGSPIKGRVKRKNTSPWKKKWGHTLNSD